MGTSPTVHQPGQTLRLASFYYIHKTGDRASAACISKVRIITREERAKGDMYVGEVLTARGKKFLAQMAHPKNPQVYFRHWDILEG